MTESFHDPQPRASADDTGRNGLLTLTDVHKRYGGVHALRGARLHVSGPGAVHCLAGENGSGKSTLMGVLSGTVRPDLGSLRLDGSDVSFRSPHDALAKGIAMVSQETAIVADLTVTENVLLGRGLMRNAMGIDWRASHERAREILAELDLDYDPRWHLRDLSPDKRQMVEIARALSTRARVVIFDEPTSSLTSHEVTRLMSAIRRITARGVAALFVSHRLAEVFEICTEVTVLRDGSTVSSGPIDDYTPTTLVEAMVGSRLVARTPPSRSGTQGPGTHLDVRGLTSDGSFADVDLELRAGEIVGIAGLTGSGRSELLQTIFGCRTASSGAIELDGVPYDPRDVTRAMNAGFGYLPPDRKTEGLVLSLGSATNLSMASTSGIPRLAPPNLARERRRFDAARVELKLRSSSPTIPVGTLSGGNQQKVALGKWIVREPKVLMLDEPTRGVDVAAKADIHHELRTLAARGSCLMVSSSEYDELLTLCSRIIVMFQGRIIADLDRATATEARISALAGGETSA